MQDFEKLGSFYLGKRYDPARQARAEDLLLYDARDLVTHAVCVGMTGSGKTGLCIGLIEEAAIDGVPSILIDPKGDLSNLLLTFPDLSPAEFLPWVNADDARTARMSNEQYAASQAEFWKKGLADWGEDGARIGRLREAAEFAIYTPRSTAGLPVSILQSFAPPAADVLEDAEIAREQVAAAASSLLALAGIHDASATRREHILLATLVDRTWRGGRAVDLGDLIGEIRNPPFARVGALDVNSFYPEKDRFELALALNNVLASPGFSAWLEGEPLAPASLLHTAEGKPRVSIFSISHLDDNERMFFVTLLLNRVIAWMRAQTGTTSLRALLYMDEIFGFFPPVANPPAKQPLLTLLKQARAFGLGVVLATQNPVDLDYKGLSNAGTWFVGRLQTERDKARLLDGLEGAGATVPRADLDRLISSLPKRVFLMNDVHEQAPVLFETRWALSYLRGPLSREGIRSLMAPLRRSAPPKPQAGAAVAAAAPSTASTTRPVLPPAVPQYFLPPGDQPYRPMLIAAAQIRFLDAKRKVDVTRDPVFLVPIEDGPIPANWDQALEAGIDPATLSTDPPASASYAPLPSAASQPKNYPAWKRDFAAWLTSSQTVSLYRNPATGLVSNAGESERDFRVRNQQTAREARDRAVEDLRRKYAPKLATLQDRLRRAQQAVEREAEQASAQRMQTAVSVGATLLGAFLGRKAISAGTLGRATTAVRAGTRMRKESQDVLRAGETVDAIQSQISTLEWDLESETAGIQTSLDAMREQLETIAVRPKKTNISVRLFGLAWVPPSAK